MLFPECVTVAHAPLAFLPAENDLAVAGLAREVQRQGVGAQDHEAEIPKLLLAAIKSLVMLEDAGIQVAQCEGEALGGGSCF